MKNKLFALVISLLFAFTHEGFAQIQMKSVPVTVKNELVNSAVKNSSRPQKMDAAPLLQEFSKGIGFDQTKQPTTTSLKKTNWTFTVGSTYSWYSADMASYVSGQGYDFDLVPSTCRAVGEHCYVFVEDALWGTNVNQAAVDSVRLAFDSRTPANPNKGIYQTDTEVFGNPPNFDGDDKIIILILDIKDSFGVDGQASYIAGYFYAYNEYPKAEYPYSNEGEIYFMDAVQANLLDEDGLQDALSTCAHEFQHMIHYNYLPKALTFINEAWSLGAEIINGYAAYAPTLYANYYDYYTFDWGGDLKDYSRGSRFALYLYEQFGTSIFGEYLKYCQSNNSVGLAGLNGALSVVGSTRDYSAIMEDWFIANYVNDKNINTEWGYEYEGLPQMAPKDFYTLNVSGTDSVNSLGVKYLSFLKGSNLSATFSYGSNATKYSGLNVKAALMKDGIVSSVEDVTFGTAYSVAGFGTDYDRVTFIVYQNNKLYTKKFEYKYSITGESGSSVTELAYDTTEPRGYLALTAGDSTAVVFAGISGAKLDSVKIAVRNLIPMPGGVYTLKGNQTAFTGKLLASFTATPTLTTAPAVINQGGDYPYEQPYKNWVKVDLTSSEISAANDFTVALPVQGEYPTKNRVMITYLQSSASYNSFWYSREDSKWLYYSVGSLDGYIYLNLIRAYVSFGTTDAKETIELLPTAYSLDQNYPNPFNPSTVISYTLPKASNVNIKIFDALGKEVRSLIDEEKSAGKYNIMWDSRNNYGQRVSSGIYFYTINAGDFVQTKKMVLVK
jgi:hypothetical protein